MSKSNLKIDNGQMSIFEYLQRISGPEPSSEGKFKIIDQLRASLRSAIKQSPLSRHQIVGEMSHLLGENVSKAQLDSWTRESDEINGRPGRHIPAEFLPAFCRATGNTEPIEILARQLGLFILPAPEQLEIEVAKLNQKEKAIRAERKKRMVLLEELKRSRRRNGEA